MSEETKIPNPHDKFFREVSSKPDNARSLLQNALPANILALMDLESLLLSSTVNEVSTETLKEIVEQALSRREGEYIITLAEKLRMEGEIKGEIKGLRQGLPP